MIDQAIITQVIKVTLITAMRRVVYGVAAIAAL
jgi:hypothetical protein